MLFEFEPSGINDTYLRITRRGVSCLVAPAGVWNGLLRVNCIVAGAPSGIDPHMIFRCLEIGWDDGRFAWKGLAAPILTNPPMIEVILERGMVSDKEAEKMLFAAPSVDCRDERDEVLMLRASLCGCSFTAIHDRSMPGQPEAAICGFSMRTLSNPQPFILLARDGLPVLNDDARDALRAQIKAVSS